MITQCSYVTSALISSGARAGSTQRDISLLAGLGLNAFRFSVEWSRIEPERDAFSRAALAHYRRVLTACHEAGVTPVVTFHHFTSPRWIAASGGWGNPDTAMRFAGVCERVMRELGDLIPWACTLNEPNLGRVLHRLMGIPHPRVTPGWAAAAKELGTTPEDFALLQHEQGREVAQLAHRLAVDAIKSVRADCLVGLALAIHDWSAEPGGEELLDQLRRHTEDEYLEGLEGDFVGVQSYMRARVGPNGPLAPSGEPTAGDNEFDPDALGGAIRRAAKVSGLPVLVTENGIATDDDRQRVAFVERAVANVESCLRDGIDVRGYIHWSLMDNFEWVSGYGPKMGLVAVDRETFERTVKPSARRLGDIAAANGLRSAR
jgi:beta-glucosidase